MPSSQSVVAAAVKREYLVPATTLDSQPYGFFYDLDAYRSNNQELRDSFPEHWHHATAVKTNPLAAMLQIARKDGHGAECASIGEVIHSLQMGFEGPDIVFDCPCKTIPEIKHAIDNKVMLNIDNMQELTRVKDIVGNMSAEDLEGCVIGFRINPLVGFGAVANLSVATRKSKFGVICPVDGEGGEDRALVVKALAENTFINAVHVHTGSGGMSLAQMADGAAGAANLAMEVNGLRGPDQSHIDVIDIGGGLPVTWGAEQSPTFPQASPSAYTPAQTPTLACPQYAAELKEKVPSLFDGKTFRRVVTEMGAMMNCRYAFFASLCEVTNPNPIPKHGPTPNPNMYSAR
jgi:diaminopimelate decarboxylase